MATTQSKTQRANTALPDGKVVPTIDAKTARRKVNAFLALHVGEMLRAADEPLLWIKLGWAVPVRVATPDMGVGELVGILLVDADSGEVTLMGSLEQLSEKTRSVLRRTDPDVE